MFINSCILESPVSQNGHIPNHYQNAVKVQMTPNQITENHITEVDSTNVNQDNKNTENNAQTKLPNGGSKISNSTRESGLESSNDINKDQNVGEGVQEYEQGTGEFIPVLDNKEGNTKTANSDNTEHKTDDSLSNKHKKLTKSVSEGNGFNTDSVAVNKLSRTNSSKDFQRSSSVDVGHVHDIVAQIESYGNVSKLQRKHSDKEQLMSKYICSSVTYHTYHGRFLFILAFLVIQTTYTGRQL